MRNQHPAQVLVQSMPPRMATVVPAGEVVARADAAHSNLFLFGSRAGTAFRMDGEYLRAALRANVGLGQGFELGVELPFAHTSGGFLDSFVIDYHDLFGFPDQGRDTAPRNLFDIEAIRSGQSVWGVQASSFAWLDVPLTLAWSPSGRESGGAPTQGFDIALRAGIELPTGNDERGYGNGEIDATFGAVLEYRGQMAALYAHAQHTFAGTPAPSRRANFRFADVTAAGLGAELPLTPDFAVLAQVAVETSTLRELELRQADQLQALLWIGGRWQVDPCWSLEFAFGEDLIGHISPDFTAWVGAVWRPGGWRR